MNTAYYANRGLLIAVCLCVVVFLSGAVPVYAHPGDLAPDGCHHCWTNCVDWGQVYGERHCHRATTVAVGSALMCTPTPAQHDQWLRGLLRTEVGIRYLLSVIAGVAIERDAED